MIIWLNGAFGSGKTTCAFELNRKCQIGRCIEAFDTEITEEKILTDNTSADYVVEEIAKRSGVTLLPDNRTFLKKEIDRSITLIRHIRWWIDYIKYILLNSSLKNEMKPRRIFIFCFLEIVYYKFEV